MTHPITELAAAAFIICAAVGTMFAVQPTPKPEPPPARTETTQEALKCCEANPARMCFVRVEPDPVKTDAERVEEVEKDLEDVNKRQQSLAERVKKATEKERGKK